MWFIAFTIALGVIAAAIPRLSSPILRGEDAPGLAPLICSELRSFIESHGLIAGIGVPISEREYTTKLAQALSAGDASVSNAQTAVAADSRRYYSPVQLLGHWLPQGINDESALGRECRACRLGESIRPESIGVMEPTPSEISRWLESIRALV